MNLKVCFEKLEKAEKNWNLMVFFNNAQELFLEDLYV